MLEKIRGRGKSAAGEPRFIVFFVLGVIVFGGAGIFNEIYHIVTDRDDPIELGSLMASIASYFCALGGVVFIQAIFEKQGIGPVANQKSVVVGFARIGHAAIVMAAVDIALVKVEMLVPEAPLSDTDFQIGIAFDVASFAA